MPYITKAPSLIFEVLSKSTALKDQNLKFKIYETEGVNYYVLVDPESHSAKIYKLVDCRYVKYADVSDEKVDFKLDGCEIAFNFSLIWP